MASVHHLERRKDSMRSGPVSFWWSECAGLVGFCEIPRWTRAMACWPRMVDECGAVRSGHGTGRDGATVCRRALSIQHWVLGCIGMVGCAVYRGGVDCAHATGKSRDVVDCAWVRSRDAWNGAVRAPVPLDGHLPICMGRDCPVRAHQSVSLCPGGSLTCDPANEIP